MSLAPTHSKGLANELKAAHHFAEQGWEVYFPLLTQSPHDLIVMRDQEIHPIQVKTAHWITVDDYRYLQVRLRKFRPVPQSWLIAVYEKMMWNIPQLVWKESGSLYLNGQMRAGYNSDDWKITVDNSL